MTARYMTRARLGDLESQLADRDWHVLRSVTELRFVSGDQLRRMHFGDGDAQSRAARRALLRLTTLGVLTRLPRRVGGVRAGSAGFIYRSGSAGQRLASARGWLPSGQRRSVSPGTLFLRHCLDVAELHTLLHEADRAGQVELLALDSEPGCWRSFAGRGIRGAATLKPDSFVRLGVGDYEFVSFIEVDRGTHGSRAIGTKLGQYVSYHQSGIEQAAHGVFPKVVWTVPDEGRAEVIWSCIGQLARPARSLFAVTLLADVLAAVVKPVSVSGSEV